MDKVAAKGGRDALVMMDDVAMVVSVKNRTVITALGRDQAKDNVFTNIDSAVVAAIAVDALGADNVHGVSMPSRYSSDATRADARRLAASLAIDFREIEIEPAVSAFTDTLAPSFAEREPDLTEENLQARVRGTLLMALSNKFGWLVIATGNKSELSVGYSTLYGDLAGGFALLKDVYKTDVFRLAEWLNDRAGRELIPRSIIDRAPSAELRADQRDEDSLPPYPVLDRILEAYVERDRSVADLEAGRDEKAVGEHGGLVGLAGASGVLEHDDLVGLRLDVGVLGGDRPQLAHRRPVDLRDPGVFHRFHDAAGVALRRLRTEIARVYQ